MLNNGGNLLGAEQYLGNVKVEAKALSLPLHLPHAQLAGELTGAEAEPLQSERAVQVPLGTIPDVVERDLLQKKGKKRARTSRDAAAQKEPACLKHAVTGPPASNTPRSSLITLA